VVARRGRAAILQHIYLYGTAVWRRRLRAETSACRNPTNAGWTVGPAPNAAGSELDANINILRRSGPQQLQHYGRIERLPVRIGARRQLSLDLKAKKTNPS